MTRSLKRLVLALQACLVLALSACSAGSGGPEWLFPVVAPSASASGGSVPSALGACLEGVKARVHVGGDAAIFLIGVSSGKSDAERAYGCVRKLPGYRAGTISQSPPPN